MGNLALGLPLARQGWQNGVPQTLLFRGRAVLAADRLRGRTRQAGMWLSMSWSLLAFRHQVEVDAPHAVGQMRAGQGSLGVCGRGYLVLGHKRIFKHIGGIVAETANSGGKHVESRGTREKRDWTLSSTCCVQRAAGRKWAKR